MIPLFLDTISELWLWEFVSRLHPLIVHFPIGALIIAFFLELFTFGGKHEELRPGIRWLVCIGAGTSVIAVILGLMLAYGGNYPASTLDYHQWTGIATAVLSLTAVWLLYRAETSGRSSDLTIYRGTLTATVLVLSAAGHFGASLTHGDDYLTSALPWNYEAPDRGEVTELLTEIVAHSEIGPLSEPHLNELNLGVRRIFAHSCYRCHASDTDDAEGGLELDSEHAVMAREIVATNRETEPTLLQALELTNGEVINEVLSRGADRWLEAYGDNPEELIRQVYLRALNREPGQREVELAGQVIGASPTRDGVQDFLWAIVMQPEFQFIY